MHRLSIQLVAAALLALASGSGLAADRPPSTTSDLLGSLFDDPIVAQGEGVTIKRSQVDEAFIALRANLAMRRQTIPENLRRLREAQLLERLILNRLMVQRATDADRDKGREIATRLLEETQKEFPSAEAFERRVKALGLSPEEFYRRVNEQALADAVIDRELKSNLTVTDAQVRDFYDHGTDVLVRAMEEALQKLANDPDATLSQLTNAREEIQKVRQANLARLERPEQVRVQHIFMLTRDRDTELPLPDTQLRVKRQKMDRLLTRARTGDDFATLVLEHSEDQALVKTQGEYVLSRNDPFVPEFKAAAFSLETNQISDVVTTPFGMHIIKLLERLPASKIEFEKAAPDMKDFLLHQEVQKALPDFFARVKAEANVKILDPRYVIELPGPSARTGG